MKKRFFLIFMIFILASSFAWADNMATGLSMAGGGVAIGTVSFLFLDTPWNYIGLGAGVLLIAGGIWLAITPDSNAAVKIENNKILQHVVFDATADKLTFGVRFRQ